MLKKINIPTILGFSLLFSVLTVVTFMFAWGKDEGTLGNNFAKNIIADSFSIFRFPTHILFWDLFSSTPFLFFFGLVLNCLFYGLITERLIFLLR